MYELCLGLVVDGSGSVPRPVYERMVEAHADALLSPPVVRLVESGGLAVAMVVIESGARVVMPWTGARNVAELRQIAAGVRADRRSPISEATVTGLSIETILNMETPGCERLVVDVATDGVPNDEVEPARQRVVDREGQINVVVVATEQGQRLSFGSGGPLEWARRELVTPGGFVLEANSWEEWMQAIRRKIVIEVGSLEE